MIPRLKSVIAHGHDTKPPEEDGEDTVTSWGTKPSPKAKRFEENLADTPTRGWGNIPNPRKDPTLTRGWGNRPNLKRNPTGIEV